MKSLASSQEQLNQLKDRLIDPLASELIEKVEWIYLKGVSNTKNELYPIAISGEGPKILMLHGFDSCFLEFRRLIPLLRNKYQLIIPDMYGFGFCPRPNINNYGIQSVILHLTKVIEVLSINSSIGIIGASMGGTVAIELARKLPKKINRLLLLSPAGICNNPTKVMWPLDQLGVLFLKQSCVRRSLCRQAFANPKESVGEAEEQIASIHLNVPGWHRSLSSFARNGGVANSGEPIPNQPINVLWGAQDRILNSKERKKSMVFLNKDCGEIENCGHLPHLDRPKIVAENCHLFFK